MLYNLSNYEKYKVLRPIIGQHSLDSLQMPIIKKAKINSFDWNNLNVTNLQNCNSISNRSNTLLLCFNYDKKLLSLWNNPLKYVPIFQTYAAVATPDYSIYPNMHIYEITHNIYMSRWLGVTWQNYGCTIIPTVGWALPDTYDICFSGLEKNSIVIISTLGCHKEKEIFLQGFNEMKKRIQPPLIIVYGDMIKGMSGNFINFKYGDCFFKKYQQLRLNIPKIFYIEEEF